MPLPAWFLAIVVGATCVVTPVRAQDTDDSLKVYAVSFSKTPLLGSRFSGPAIYLGRGFVLTVRHLAGSWSLFTDLRVQIGGQDLPATIVKASRAVDLTLMSVDETRLPVSLRLRRNPICRDHPINSNEPVVVVSGAVVARSWILSPAFLSQEDRKLGSVIADLPAGSGSGIFLARKKCLLGILRSRVTKYKPQEEADQTSELNEDAGYFVPASTILDFVPPEARF